MAVTAACRGRDKGLPMKKLLSAYGILVGCIILAGLCYGLFYFDYLETPTEDFIGNFRPRVAEYLSGGFPGSNSRCFPSIRSSSRR